MKAQYQENQTVNPLGSPAMVINTPPVGQEKPKPSRESDSAAPLARWFSNLPIKRKQLGALLLSELISIGGLSSIGALLIYLTGQRQLASQAQSEVAVTQIGYMIKVNQMGFGFRGQSDNLAIINAAKDYKQGKPIDDKLRGQVGEILRNEVKARKIEYATLVGSDYRIIVNANRDRRGEVFNPENLVTQVFKNPQQLKASAIISRQELMKEGAPQWSTFEGDNVLIRYTVTPVKDPVTKQVIGALISGDIVNGKTPIVEQALNAFGGGYSGIYLRQPKTGKYSLVVSLDLPPSGNLDNVQKNVPLPSTEILTKALGNGGKPVTERLDISNQTYTMAARTIPNLYREGEKGPVMIPSNPPVAFLVRGTPETSLNALLRQSLLLQLGLALVALSVALALASLLRRAIVTPVEQLQKIARGFAQGDRQARAQVLSTDEVGQLSSTFNELADNIVESDELRETEAKRKQLFADVAKVKEANQLTAPFNQLLTEVRSILDCDRVVIYRFLPNGDGYIAGENLVTGLPSATSANLKDSCIGEELKEAHRKGRVVALANVAEASLHPEHRQLLEGLQVKSLLIVPISQTDALFGFAIAHHCRDTHVWQPQEQEYLQEFADQLAQSLSGLALFEQKEMEAEREMEQNRVLQEELFTLLSDVEGAASGDLTVRAEISAGQIGIVADFFNAILENLRDLVTQVKGTATQVNTSVQSNEQVIRRLADEAQAQAYQISDTLNSVEAMTASITAVASNAQSAALISRQASDNAQTGGVAMERTVDSILQLRDTIAETGKKVKRLGESSQQISKVIALINQIALKTNLLAVNASIEAARAGEEGRGFAVVAEEVGQLAAQSALATKEIEQIVEAIQRETREVVSAMELGTTQVVEGTKLVEQTKGSLQQIVTVSGQIDKLLQSISKATVSQTASSQRVTQLMEAIAQVSEKTSETSSLVSSNLQETVSVAQKLQTSVETFKVD
jgi:twitching motility protein PilJ